MVSMSMVTGDCMKSMYLQTLNLMRRDIKE